MWGRLTAEAFRHDMIEWGAGVMMLVAALGAVFLLTYYKKWQWLWDEWLTSLDPKKIGIMYIAVAAIMLFKGIVDGIMMRAQQMLAVGDSHGYLTSSHFQQIFTAHGTTMIFFVGMGIVFGLMNLIVPLQIGARDVAFPFLNSVSFWLFAVASVLLNLSLIVGNFSGAGWLAYPPLSGLQYNPGVGIDYWIWTLQIAGVGSLLGGINFIVTIFKMRCPGMTWMKMPVFVWSALGCLILIIFAFPVLTATLGMLSLDRYLGMHFFTPEAGGSPMMFVNLIWAWGHPEVYILILPAFGVFSEVVATYSQKRLFGYTSMVWAIIAIVFLSFIVWLHHFFTMGAGPKVNAFFGIMTMLIAIPTGVKIFNWLFTMVQGRLHVTSPIIWFLGFVFLFTVGGMTGVLMSVPPADFQVHNSLFLIAHFHSMILPGVVFGFFAGFTYWFPKFTGFTLNERLGKWACGCWILGFILAFMPLFLLGLMGATRRLDHYEASTGWQPLFILAAIGVLILAIGVAIQVAQILVSIKERKKNLDTTGDPWNGRTLEWATSSPPAIYNFAHIPHVHERDAFWEQKSHPVKKEAYKEIHLPKNSPIGFLMGVFSFFLGFALTWRMWWLAILSLVAIFICTVVRLWGEDEEVHFTVAEIKRIESGRG
jgi:cytochrome o ubiquinol oxidase subunit I